MFQSTYFILGLVGLKRESRQGSEGYTKTQKSLSSDDKTFSWIYPLPLRFESHRKLAAASFDFLMLDISAQICDLPDEKGA